MTFKEITITNFLSYFEDNRIEFSPMTSIIIGQNNTGKSKFFDAVNFALYGRVYDTQKENWVETESEISGLILNKHKINEALKENLSEIKSRISLVIDDVSNQNILLEIERSYTYKLVNGVYRYSTKNVVLSEIDNFAKSTYPFFGNDAEERIKSYFPDSIKNFFLFQGEAASKIMQLQKGGNFRQAVKEIAKLKLFEDAKDYAGQYVNSVDRSIQIKTTKNEKAKAGQKKRLENLDSKKEEQKRLEKKKADADSNIANYSSIKENCENVLSELKEFENWFDQKKEIEERKKRVQREIDGMNKEKTLIAEEYVFYKVKDKITEFKEFYSRLEKKGEVPPSIPQAEIRKALDCCRCTICNADLSVGTDGRKFAESRLAKGDTDKLGEYLRKLNNTVGDFYEDVVKVPKRLGDLLERKRNSDTKKNNLIHEEETLTQQLNTINLEGEESEEKRKKISDAKKKLNEYATLLERAQRESSKAEGQLEMVKDEISKIEKDLRSLVIGDADVRPEDKDKLRYASKLRDVMEKLFEVANDAAYKQVEERANQYYKEMTEENAAIVGDIKIDLQTSEIYTVDEAGNKILNINQANRISMQLAVIAGILTVAQEQFEIRYPFVTDAPVSHLGGDNKSSTIRTMVNAFEQAIIILKDDTSTKNQTNDEIRKYIRESSEVEVAYELCLSKSENINDQYTVVKKIKG